MKVNGNILAVETSKLAEIMQAFYTVTHIKSTLYDKEFNEILTYPSGACDFCCLVREKHLDRCIQSDLQAFADCARKGVTVRYCCHMGLYEVVSPLCHAGNIIGYIMFGQMLPKERTIQLRNTISQVYPDSETGDRLKHALQQMEPKSQEEIDAATLLMETCIYYLLSNQIVRVDQGNFVDEMNRYISSHISEEITVADLYHYFGMSRSSFYLLVRQCLNCSIVQHIKSMRIAKARDLLQNTDIQITKISELVGFLDYNYFLRVFKKETGCSCKEYRLKNR